MTQVRGFVKENRASLTRNISGLNRISKTLVKQRDALDKTLTYAPAALNNLYLAGNVKQGTLDTRDNIGELLGQLQDDPAATLCTLIGQANPPGGVCSQLSAIRGASPRAPALSGSRRPDARARGRAHRPVHGRTRGGDSDEAPSTARAPPRSLAALLAGALVLSGCSVYDVPLPGGADTGKNPMKVTLMFRDVLDLVPQSTVKVDDVTVGKVKSIKLKGYVAEVDVEVPGDLKLPENTTAQIRQTSLLGEKFIQLDRPREPRQRPALQQRRDRARPHRSQPRGRRGLRRARPAAQRRWRRPAQDHRLRAEQRLHRARGRGALGPDPDPHLHGPARREQGVHRRGAGEHQPPGRGDPQAGRHHQERAGRHPRRPALGRTVSAPTWSSCSRP